MEPLRAWTLRPTRPLQEWWRGCTLTALDAWDILENITIIIKDFQFSSLCYFSLTIVDLSNCCAISQSPGSVKSIDWPLSIKLSCVPLPVGEAERPRDAMLCTDESHLEMKFDTLVYLFICHSFCKSWWRAPRLLFLSYVCDKFSIQDDSFSWCEWISSRLMAAHSCLLLPPH